ncbi:MAG: hypothetical protein H7Z43_07750 [Clostridia bacterium]|nr:hypothetical protein [Deltaproteobacteria bacterium]
MSPLDARVAMLIAELERDWHQVKTQLVEAQSVEPSRNKPEAALVALSLDHAYQAFESLLLRLENALGLPPRANAEWHTRLLEDAMMPIANVRPSVYPATAASDWNHLLRFRHFLRHAYGAPLDAGRLATNRDRLASAVAATDSYLLALLNALGRD